MVEDAFEDSIIRDTNIKCPACGHHYDALMSIGEHRKELPTTGDVAVCLNCGAICKFVNESDNVSLEYFSETEMNSLEKSARWPEVLKLREQAIRLGELLRKRSEAKIL